VQPGALPSRQEDRRVAQGAQHALAGAQGGEAVKHQRDGAPHLLVGILEDPPILQADEAGGQVLAVGPVRHLPEASRVHAQA